MASFGWYIFDFPQTILNTTIVKRLTGNSLQSSYKSNIKEENINRRKRSFTGKDGKVHFLFSYYYKERNIIHPQLV